MSAGLEGVVAAETVLSHVDGAAGRLILRGLGLEQAAARLSFEETLALLWRDFTAVANDPAALPERLGSARARAFEILARPLEAARGLEPVEGLRLLLSAIGDGETLPHELLAVAAMPVFAAALDRQRRGLEPVPPDPSLGHAADYLRMLHGAPVEPDIAKALDTYLVTVIDHGLNASTFAARVIASTRAGIFSAVVGGLCALKGPLHGGAPGPVLDMLDAIGTPDRIVPWVKGRLAAGERLMGFGHRVYKVRDPRADVLKGVVRGLKSDRIDFAEQVEREVLATLARTKPGRRLDTNVEFYTALVLEAVGLPRSLFTPTFAVGRVGGWTAHILEQEKTGRILRPLSDYVGPPIPEAAE